MRAKEREKADDVLRNIPVLPVDGKDPLDGMAELGDILSLPTLPLYRYVVEEAIAPGALYNLKQINYGANRILITDLDQIQNAVNLQNT